jgi:hypothetical protein
VRQINHDKHHNNLEIGVFINQSGLEPRNKIRYNNINNGDHIQPEICRLVEPKAATATGKAPFRDI